jgi:hypothetical protein
MDLDFPPTGPAVLGQALHDSLLVLLCRKEVRVPQGLPIGVAERGHSLRIRATPVFYSPFLLVEARVGVRWPIGHDGGLEVIRDRND